MDKNTSGLEAPPYNNELSRVAEQITGYFVNEEEDLTLLLTGIGVDNIEDLLGKMVSFFDMHLDLIDSSEIAVEEIDLLQLVTAFVKDTGLTFPVDKNARDSKQIQDTVHKLGRVVIHRLLFAELIRSHPNLAYSVKNLLFRFVKDVCIIEDLNYYDIVQSLKLDEIVIPFQKGLNVGEKTGLKYRQIKDEFLELRKLTEVSLHKLAKQLKRDYAAISSIPRFCSLFNSKGEDFEPLDIRESKLYFIVHLIYRMRHPYNKACKPLIGMNKGKGIWRFLQENLTFNGNTYGRELAKISSEINSPSFLDKHQVKKQVRELLDQFYESSKK